MKLRRLTLNNGTKRSNVMCSREKVLLHRLRAVKPESSGYLTLRSTDRYKSSAKPAAIQVLLELIGWIIDDRERLCLDGLVITAICIKN